MIKNASGIIPYPTGMLRTIARLPLSLYRLGLGWLVGLSPFIVLTTRGRSSGQARHVVLEWRRHGRKYYVISAFGTRPHWYQNALAHPCVTIQSGRRALRARAVPVTDRDEKARAVYMFRKNSPIYEAVLTSISTAETIDFRTLAEMSHEFTVIRLEPEAGPPELPGITGLPPWVVPLALVGLLIGVRWLRPARSE
ncbi:MAG: nitroreductase family deazaflavin-dependent oxidoreductase [Anaerolineae bacterium]|nr:nitroreductase family deazaflavin-dependent oxidoreductase [Anaerolineae bacterium]